MNKFAKVAMSILALYLVVMALILAYISGNWQFKADAPANSNNSCQITISGTIENSTDKTGEKFISAQYFRDSVLKEITGKVDGNNYQILISEPVDFSSTLTINGRLIANGVQTGEGAVELTAPYCGSNISDVDIVL